MGNSSSKKDAETVSKFNQVKCQANPWTSTSADALNIVNDDECAICAAAARQIYEGESSFFDLMEAALNEKGFIILRKTFLDGKLEEDHTEETHPPMGSIIYRDTESYEATLLLVFRGSTTGYDWTANVDAPPIPSPLWHEEWPHIKVHKGWGGEIWRYFSEYCGVGLDGSPKQRVDGGDRVPDLVKEFNVTKILFSGHSLGGALAQIASFGGMLMVQKIRELDQEIPELQMRTFTFAAPMPVYFKEEELNDEERHALNEIRRTSYNVVFDLDVVPHIPGHHEWIQRLSPDLIEAAGNAAKSYAGEFLWGFVKGYVQPISEKLAQMSVEKARHFKNYRHVSQIVHFDLNHADSLAGFNAFNVKILSAEEFGQVEYPFPASKDRRFKALLGLQAHSCLPQTVAYGSFSCFPTLLIIGGYDGSYLDSVEECKGTSFAPSKSSMQEKRDGPCAAVIAGQVYVVGGGNSASYLGSVERYNPEGGNWTMLPGAMNTPRRECAGASVDGRLYVMGGYDGKNLQKSVEMYDTRTESWSTVASMGSKRYGCAAVSLGGKVYVFGGLNFWGHLNSGEVYDPKKNKWRPLPTKMKSKRHRCAAAVLGDKIYVAGGHSGSSYFVEVYDPGAGTWSYLSARMHTERYGCAAAVMGGKLYVAGGQTTAGSSLDSVEVYDPATGSWTVMTMGSKRYGCAAAVV